MVDFLSMPDVEKRDLSSLSYIGGGGAPLPRAVGEKLHELTGIRYVEGYGLTETIAQTHFNPPDRPKLQCLGVPSFDVDARIIDLDSGKELGPREQGEIVVRGPQVFKGYWRRPEETERAFITLDGKPFFRTGDIGYYDEEGYFFIVDRAKRMINVSGYKVWPTEVESVLYQHPEGANGLRRRRSGSAEGGDGEGLHHPAGAPPRPGDGGGNHRVVPGADGRLQVPAPGGVRRAAADDGERKDPVAGPAGKGAGEGQGGRRPLLRTVIPPVETA